MEHFCPSYESAISPSYGTPGGSNHTCSIGGTPIYGQWPGYGTPKNHCSIAGTPCFGKHQLWKQKNSLRKNYENT